MIGTKHQQQHVAKCGLHRSMTLRRQEPDRQPILRANIDRKGVERDEPMTTLLPTSFNAPSRSQL
jgi:hypothetical protein